MNRNEYAKYYNRILAWSDEDEAYVVRVPELPGCVTHGETVEEAVEMADEAVDLYLESMIENGQRPPEPASLLKGEKKFLLRIERSEFAQIKMSADEQGLSINEYIAKVMRSNQRGEVNPARPRGKKVMATAKQPRMRSTRKRA